jgi:phenylacetate-CoA ligase
VGCLDGEPCPCGRGLPTWRIIGGREKELLATTTGYLHPLSSFLGTPRWRDKIQGIRFYQETRHDVVAQIIKGPEFRDEDLPGLRDEIEQCLEGRLSFSIQFFQSLEETAGGKYRFVVSKVPIEI